MKLPTRRSSDSSSEVAEVLRRHGQQLWLRGFRRCYSEAAPVADLIRDGVVTGLCVDLDHLEPALLEGAEYAAARRRVAEKEADAATVGAEALLEDAAHAAALLARHSASDETQWLAVDLPPAATMSSDDVVDWARRLREAAGHGQVLVRLPGTPKGLEVLENLAAAGYGAYVQNLFSVDQVEATLAAHQRGLRLARTAGVDLAGAALVAAVQLVRLDVAVDELLRDAIARGSVERDALETLFGKASVASARVAHAALEKAIRDREWSDLTAAGAPVPRLAWESARNLSPARRDVELMEELVGPNTVSVVTWDGLTALLDHGHPSPRLGRHHEEAREVLTDLGAAGIEIDALAKELQTAATAADREGRARLAPALTDAAALPDRMLIAAGGLGAQLESAIDQAAEQQLADRIWARDAELWATDPDDQRHVRNRLGWLSLPETMLEQALPLAAIAKGRAGGTDQRVALLGMGGSSLGAEAIRTAFAIRDFDVVDTTVPRGVAVVASRVEPERALFLVSSKSGTTVETLALERFFAGQLQSLEDPASRFVAVTDPGTPLHELARERGFLRVWLAPPDVGGRYSVLSVFGMLPAALMSVDIVKLLDRSRRMAVDAGPHVPAAQNPAILLGLLMSTAAAAGRNKLTFFTSPRLAGFADWAEQLIAESSGKDGRGIVPVSQEPHGLADAYGDDRIFVQLVMEGEAREPATETLLDELQAAGHPIVRIRLDDAADIGREFFRWEFATAVACAGMGVNAFDEPNVRDAKQRANAALASVSGGDGLPEPAAIVQEESLKIIVPPGDVDAARMVASGGGAEDWIGAHLRRARPGDYFAILAFLAPETPTWHALQGLRALVRDRLGVATTAGWGPRFLHSTGQLHKGGDDSGLFLQITADDSSDLEIPGENYSFAALARAQAVGDFEALSSRGRRLLRVHLTGPPEQGLARLLELARLSLTTDSGEADG
jgi:transaldolase/glucose-6-phosphate isomerase